MSVISVGNLVTVHRLRRRALPLCPDVCRLPAYSPVWNAVAGSLWGDDQAAVTLVASTPGTPSEHGFSQVRPLPHRRSAEMLYIAPAPEDDDVPAVWDLLLARVANWALARGMMRVLVAVPVGEAAERGFGRNGYGRYAGDTVYQRPFPTATAPRELPLQPRRPVDEWGLQQLWAAATPLRVQQAEGLAGRGSADEAGRAEHLLLHDQDGIQAELQLHRGNACHRLRLRVRPGCEDLLPVLVREALALVARWPARPVRCCVPEYEAPLATAIRDGGFVPVAERALLVRYSVLPVRPVLEESLTRLPGTLSNGRRCPFPEPSNSVDRCRLATAGAPPAPEWSDDRSTNN